VDVMELEVDIRKVRRVVRDWVVGVVAIYRFVVGGWYC